MNLFMRKLFLVVLAFLFLGGAVFAEDIVIDMTTDPPVVTPVRLDVDLGAISPDDGSYAQSFTVIVRNRPAGSIVDVNVYLADYVRSGLDIFPIGALGWQLYYVSPGYLIGTPRGLKEKVPFYIGTPTTALSIDRDIPGEFKAEFGLQLRVPAVQPAGRYTGTIMVEAKAR